MSETTLKTATDLAEPRCDLCSGPVDPMTGQVCLDGVICEACLKRLLAKTQGEVPDATTGTT
jgi:hypothetical protein